MACPEFNFFIMELSIYFPHLSAAQLEVMSRRADYTSSGVCLNSKANEECDVICPYDDKLKRRPNVLSKVMDPNVNPLERDRLMSTLQKVPVSKRNNLSDDELISMTPSRYNQTMTDDAAFASHLSHVVDDYSDSDSSASSSQGSDNSDSSNSDS